MENHKLHLFIMASLLLLFLDLTCTYITFAVIGFPLGYEMNPLFRRWIIQDGWTVSLFKFILLKTILFFCCGWLIFKTRLQIFTILFAQVAVTNHLVAILSHPTLWWLTNWEWRSWILMAAGIASLVLTFFGIRFLRAVPPLPSVPPLVKAQYQT